MPQLHLSVPARFGNVILQTSHVQLIHEVVMIRFFLAQARWAVRASAAAAAAVGAAREGLVTSVTAFSVIAVTIMTSFTITMSMLTVTVTTAPVTIVTASPAPAPAPVASMIFGVTRFVFEMVRGGETRGTNRRMQVQRGSGGQEKHAASAARTAA